MTSTDTTPTAPHSKCICGCKRYTISRNANYLPGHDARHSWAVVQQLAVQVESGECSLAEAAQIIDRKFPTARLAELTVGRLAQRVATTPEVHHVKIGRWTYPARTDANGRVTRYQFTSLDKPGGKWLPV